MTNFRRISVFTAFLGLALTTMSFSLNGSLDKTAFRLQNLNLAVTGTSTLHDWEIKSAKGQAEVNLELASDKLTGISGLSFSIPAESLKSGNNMMDNNTYKDISEVLGITETNVATKINRIKQKLKQQFDTIKDR